MALTRSQLLLAVGLPLSYVAWGYLTYYVPRIHLIPYAFLAGIICCALAGLALTLLTVRPYAYRDAVARSGITPLYREDAPARAAFTSTPRAWKESKEWLAASAEYRRKSLWPTNPAVSEKIDQLLSWIYRDFVSSWYANISKLPSFLNEVDRAVKGAFWTIRGRLEDQDLVKSGVQRIVPLFTSHVRLFHDAEVAVRGRDLSKSVTESEELDLAIAGKYGSGSGAVGYAKLHPAASLTFSDLKTVQQEYVRRLIKKILPKVLPAYFVESKAVCIIVEEIVSCAIIVPLMQIVADPDTWNQIMEAYGRTVLQDRKSVQKLRKALDEHASPVAQKIAPRAFPRLSPDDDERKFERFVRAIRRCNDISEARRFRSEVASQLKRAADAGTGADQVYVRRLETSKRLLDQRVGLLSTVGSSEAAAAVATTPTKKPEKASASGMRLQDVLYSAAGLSYFMEYMDRIGLMSLVQYYIVVDGFRNPLEDDFLEDHKVAESSLKWSESDKQDIAQINQSYLSRLELRVPATSKDAVRQFLKAGRRATPVQYQRARSAILRTQTSVFEEMRDKYFAGYQESDLWYKFVTSEDGAAANAARSNARALNSPSKLSLAGSARSSLDVPRMARTTTAEALTKAPSDLKRNALSTSNLGSLETKGADSPVKRISFDVDPSKPLFEDEVEPEAMGESIASLDDYDELTPAKATEGDNAQVVDAMQAALDDIMAGEGTEADRPVDGPTPLERPSLFGGSSDMQSSRSSGELMRTGSPAPGKARQRPDLASLGLVSSSSRIGVFKDNDLFGDEPKFKEDEQEEPETPTEEKEDMEEIHQAAPGDLGLAEAITALTTDIDKLVAQETIVDTLNRKAELTNNVAELRILRKSKESLQREIHRKELQRQQYIVQESDNSLFGRASVEIKSVVVGKEVDGQEFALYVVEVRRQAGESMPAASWAIARRYSEFHELHQRLRQLYPAVRELEFPRRRLMMKLQRDFLHKRRVSLQTYLQDLLQMPDVCRSRDLRAFLSQAAIVSTDAAQDAEGGRADIVSRIYNSVTDGMDEFLGNIPVLDQLTAAGQNLITAATAQYYDSTATSGPGASGADGGPNAGSGASGNREVLQATEAQAELDAFEFSGQDAALQPFISPISDLFLEVFELNRSNNASWLRGRAVVVVLHQLLGGTVERKMRDMAQQLVGETSMLKYLASAKAALWKEDGSGLRRDKVPRSKAQKKASKTEASVTLAALVPELAGNVVGRDNAKRAARKLFAAVNNERLNVHLAFRVLDEMICMVWPDMAGEVGRM